MGLYFLLVTLTAQATDDSVLAHLDWLKKSGAKILASDQEIGVGIAKLTQKQQEILSLIAHEEGRCGGFERLPKSVTATDAQIVLGDLKREVRKQRSSVKTAGIKLPKNPMIDAALEKLDENQLRSNVEWLSSFESRFHKLPDPNIHVRALEERLKVLLEKSGRKFEIERISHQNTRQQSLRVRLPGAERPTEIVVLGGHLDSIHQSWFGGGDKAPGADDNASGSSNLMETLRVILQQPPTARTLEFFWYAGEEGGLLGSAEISQSYKSASKDVVAVLQLDMTSYPGAGEFVVGNVSDFTSAWLRGYLVALNDTYIGARLIDDQCGYACSDHASWFRRGYPTLMPFESDTDRMNSKIHTANDKIDSATSFRHSLVFSKIALALALDLGNSTARGQ